MGRVGRLVVAGGAGDAAHSGPSGRERRRMHGTGNSPHPTGDRRIRTGIATARPITGADVPRETPGVEVIASDGVWCHERANEPAWRGVDGRMREASAHRERKYIDRVVARDLTTGGMLPTGSDYATLARAYGLRRKERS